MRSDDRDLMAAGRGAGFEASREVALVLLALEIWALIAPALRSVRRRWPFARRGEIFVRDEQVVMDTKGMEVTKSKEVEVVRREFI